MPVHPFRSNLLRLRRTGTDVRGNPARLGDLDSDGVRVGYIHPDGTCWESEREFWVSHFANRCIDDYKAAQRGLRPSDAWITRFANVPLEYRGSVLRQFLDFLWLQREIAVRGSD